MNFNSLHFLIYLPVVLIVYWLLPQKARWVWLLAASYYFYMSWNAWLVFLIAGTTGVSYAAALLIERTQSKRVKKFWLAATLVVCLGVLVFFKYFNFLLQSAIDFLNLFSMGIDSFALDILLPVGISFYTFQTLSYVIDVYRGDFRAEKHFGYYALFVSYFPQLVAGPIEKPGDLIPQLRAEHKLNGEDMAAGMRILLGGFFRKCVVADFCGIYVNNVFSRIGEADSLSILMAGGLFCIQMYCDFAGYSEIATGAARMMGVRLTKNFDRPYLSMSYTEFFRRWHISLNRWFTQYLYIPLGGSRKGKARKIVNVVIVFSLCGLWHGANWTYLLWGLYAAFFVGLESLFLPPFEAFAKRKGLSENPAFRLLRRVVMFAVFIPAALLFRAQSLSEAWLAVSGIFTRFASLPAAFAFVGLDALTFAQIALSIVCMGMVWHFGRERQDGEAADSHALAASEGAFLVADVTGGAAQPVPAAAQPAPAEMQTISAAAQPVPAEMQTIPAAMQPVPAGMQPAPATARAPSATQTIPAARGQMAGGRSAWEEVSAHAFLILSVMVCWLAFLASNDASTFAYFQF